MVRMRLVVKLYFHGHSQGREVGGMEQQLNARSHSAYSTDPHCIQPAQLPARVALVHFQPSEPWTIKWLCTALRSSCFAHIHFGGQGPTGTSTSCTALESSSSELDLVFSSKARAISSWISYSGARLTLDTNCCHKSSHTNRNYTTHRAFPSALVGFGVVIINLLLLR